MNMYSTPINYYFNNDEMNINYPNILTPPSNSNEDSYSPLPPDYDTNDFFMQEDSSDFPRLKIIEQPVDKFRFRYKSEMSGTHGSLSGISSDRNRKATFPTVELLNFSGEAIIRCGLYQYTTSSSEDLKERPHAHRLIKKYGNDERDDPHDIKVSKEIGYQAQFHSMGIIHTAKKHIENELIKKKEFILMEDIARKCGQKRNLNIKEQLEIKKLAQEESKTINLNRVCLRFEALFENKDTGIFTQICEPVYSHAINNLKSALTGELKIVRMDHCTSPCTGGREVYILVEKVTKKNIKIRFFEIDDDENEVWHEYGKFNELDVHHQFAIVFKTPAYKNTNLEQIKKVFIELERPSDGARSERKEFTYTPSHSYPTGSKRPRTYNSSLSSHSSSSVEMPTVLPGSSSNDLTDLNISSLVKFFDSNEIEEILNQEDIKKLYDSNSFQMDAPDNIIKPKIPIDTFPLKKELKDLKAFICTSPSKERICLRVKDIFSTKDTIFHAAVISGNRNLVLLIIKLMKLCDLNDLLNAPNSQGATALHLAVMHNYEVIVNDLLENKVKCDVQDFNGNTPLHIAIKENLSFKIICQLITCSCDLDIENSEGQTALQLAVQGNFTNVVTELCKHNANVNISSKTTGRNILHMAIEIASVDIIQFLLQNTNIKPDTKDYSDYNCLQMAEALLNEEKPGMKEIHAIIKTYFEEKNLLEDVVKKEFDLDIDDNTLYMTEVKQEYSQIDISNMYKNVTEIPKMYFEQIVDILNYSGGWYDLANLLDLDYLIESNVIDKENPAKNLLNVALANGDSILTIRNFLENLEEHKAVSILDEMVQKFYN